MKRFLERGTLVVFGMACGLATHKYPALWPWEAVVACAVFFIGVGVFLDRLVKNKEIEELNQLIKAQRYDPEVWNPK